MRKLFTLFISVLMVFGLMMPVSADGGNTIVKNGNQITITISSGHPDLEFFLNDSGEDVVVRFATGEPNETVVDADDEVIFTTNGNIMDGDFSINFNDNLRNLPEPVTLNITLNNFKILNNDDYYFSTWNHSNFNQINVNMTLIGENEISVGSTWQDIWQGRNALNVPAGSTYKIGGNGSIKLTGTYAIASGGTVYVTDEAKLTEGSSPISNVTLYNHSNNDSWGKKIELNSIAFVDANKELNVGDDYQSQINYEPSDIPDDEKVVTYSSSNEEVATVDTNGLVSATKEGKTTITATSTIDPNIKTSCEITVVNKVYSVSVTPDKITLPSVKEGYDPQDPEYITIKNTGNQTILLEDHGENPWLTITLDKNTLKPNEEAKVSIKLKDGLSAETRSTLKGFITYTNEDGTYRDYAHFEVTYEIRHDMKHVEAKEATHLEEGNIEYWYCEYCDKYYEGALGTNELSLEDITIPKLADHTPTDTWYHDENNHYHTCECGEVLDKEAHDFKWVIDKEATTTSEGLKHEECTVCGYRKDGVAIPVLEIEIPDTGVRSNTFIWTTAALLSLSALTGSVIYQRKKKEN